METIIREMTGIIFDDMSSEKDILSAAETLLEIPPAEIAAFNGEYAKVENALRDFVAEPMNTSRGKIRASRLLIKFAALHPVGQSVEV